MKDINYKRILFPTDGSQLSLIALPHVVSLANAFDSEVVLLHVVNSIGREIAFYAAPGMYPVGLGEAAVDIVKENKRLAKKKLEVVRDKLVAGGVKKNILQVQEGAAENNIIETIKKEKCDLVVMTSHGRSGFERAIVGSVTDHVMRHATCPVLVVRPVKA
ncbi:MAG: universal stress protein [Candidatus Levybacteria bacterium]|nr:universal stress protein [Candidatus Levybacteria bacterium]